MTEPAEDPRATDEDRFIAACLALDMAQHGMTMEPSERIEAVNWSVEVRLEETVANVLDGALPYDSLTDETDQAAVRAQWERRAAERLARLNFAEEFKALGITGWVTADDDGVARLNSADQSTDDVDGADL